MQAQDVLRDLEAAASAQTAKTYRRHGVGEPLIGVKYGDLAKIERTIKGRSDLATELWATGIHEARLLALRCWDPESLTASEANALVRAVDSYVIAEAVGGFVSNTPIARDRSNRWRPQRSEWISSVGWCVLACSAQDPDVWPEAELADILEQIEGAIHGSLNRVRHEMNASIINIALRSPALEKQAIANAKRIGTVEVDHGDTGCKTPDAVTYINKTLSHRQAKAT